MRGASPSAIAAPEDFDALLSIPHATLSLDADKLGGVAWGVADPDVERDIASAAPRGAQSASACAPLIIYGWLFRALRHAASSSVRGETGDGAGVAGQLRHDEQCRSVPTQMKSRWTGRRLLRPSRPVSRAVLSARGRAHRRRSYPPPVLRRRRPPAFFRDHCTSFLSGQSRVFCAPVTPRPRQFVPHAAVAQQLSRPGSWWQNTVDQDLEERRRQRPASRQRRTAGGVWTRCGAPATPVCAPSPPGVASAKRVRRARSCPARRRHACRGKIAADATMRAGRSEHPRRPHAGAAAAGG